MTGAKDKLGSAVPPTYALISDAPPLKEGGHGMHVLTWNWIQAVGECIKLVVTHRLNPTLSLQKIQNDLPVPVSFYPDLSRVRMLGRVPALKGFLEVCVMTFALPRLEKAIRASGATRLMGFFGANLWFMFIVHILAVRTGLPLEIYLVDDLEESARHGKVWFGPAIARWFEPRLLRRAKRVFVISPGYVTHLREKYGIESQWLPIPIPAERMQHQSYKEGAADTREIVFIGAVNFLYLDSLKDMLIEISRWNAEEGTYHLKLVLMTYTDSGYLEKTFGNHPNLEIVIRANTAELKRRTRGSWAIFLPYSFSPDVKTMVSTSFPHKVVESLTAGRPVVVYGPDYASAPDYFLKNHLPLCITRQGDLSRALSAIEQVDTPALIQQYENVLDQFHSPLAIKRILLKETRPEILDIDSSSKIRDI